MKITYLLGAGASCEVLPTIQDLPGRLEYLSDNLRILLNALPPNTKWIPTVDDKGWYNIISEQFRNMAIISREHTSIDSYAKKLFLRRELQRLDSLKVMLSTYFLIESILNKGRCDKRYDNFWASIMTSSPHQLPYNVRVVTWNYDSHLEQSFLEYRVDVTLKTLHQALNICDGFMPNGYEANKFAIYKMNGTASFASDKNDRSNNFLFEHFRDGNSYENISTLINYLQDSAYSNITSHKISSTLTYACETENNHNNRQSFIGEVANDISDTDILVVIGYSFPLFNRIIDKRLFENSDINKIYIQDPNAEAIIAMLKIAFKDLNFRNNIEFEAVPSGNTFYFPAELY